MKHCAVAEEQLIGIATKPNHQKAKVSAGAHRHCMKRTASQQLKSREFLPGFITSVLYVCFFSLQQNRFAKNKIPIFENFAQPTTVRHIVWNNFMSSTAPCTHVMAFV
eukprot:TRINITY_DN4459_c0_g2_i3.p2 TRINITY_DN4459_c0_g2~~TRINITY_DN4459_c0_g2_i3.p2  ORF type:complete len:108 (+),score=3.15 TRINITY_DN4459_c0_g2_i3:341-664(+)